MFGVEPNSLLGISVELLIGENWLRDVTSQEEDRLANPDFVEINDKRFDVIIHRSGFSIIIENERVRSNLADKDLTQLQRRSPINI